MIKYLKSLFHKVVYYETTNINGEKTRSKWGLCLSRLPYLALAVVCHIFLFKDGFPDSFINIYANVLAILIGLLSASMLFGFESIYNNNKKEIEGRYEISINEEQEGKERIYIVNNEALDSNNSRDNASLTQQNNYTNQFVCFTGYNIVLCTITLFLILFVSLFEIDAYDPYNTYFIDIKNVRWEHILNFAIGVFVSIQRIFVLYAMGLIVKYSLFATTSLVHVMTTKMKNK